MRTGTPVEVRAGHVIELLTQKEMGKRLRAAVEQREETVRSTAQGPDCESRGARIGNPVTVIPSRRAEPAVPAEVH